MILEIFFKDPDPDPPDPWPKDPGSAIRRIRAKNTRISNTANMWVHSAFFQPHSPPRNLPLYNAHKNCKKDILKRHICCSCFEVRTKNRVRIWGVCYILSCAKGRLNLLPPLNPLEIKCKIFSWSVLGHWRSQKPILESIIFFSTVFQSCLDLSYLNSMK